MSIVKRIAAGLALLALIMIAPFYALLYLLGVIGVALERGGRAVQCDASKSIKRMNAAIVKAYNELKNMEG